MKISIITPCYNAERFIAQAIDSVLCQSYQNFEFIIIDDGSSDNSIAIVSKYCESDQRIIHIKQQNSGKPSIARNNGIKKSTGDILMFLDADDTMLPGKLSAVIKAFSTSEQIDVVAHDYCRIDEHGKVLGEGVIQQKWHSAAMADIFTQQNDYYVASNLYHYFLTQWVFLHVNSVAIKTANVPRNELLFDESLIFAEDIAKWCRLLQQRPLLLIKECLATYRDTPDSLMTNQLKADMAAFSFFESHLHQPLQPLTPAVLQVVREKIIKELKDIIYIAAAKGKVALVVKSSKQLIGYQNFFSSCFFLTKNILIAIIKSLSN